MADNNFLKKLKSILASIRIRSNKIDIFLEKRPGLNFVLKAGISALLTGFICLFVLIFSARIGVFGGMPTDDELKEISNPEGTELFADDGVTLLGRYYIENRSNITYDS